MNNLFLLTKINLLGTFKKNSNKGLIIFIIAFLYLAFVIYQLGLGMIDGFIMLNIPYMFLTLFMLFSSMFILATNIFKVNGTIFNFKDYDLLMSLPIKKEEIIISKILSLYFLNFLYTILFMIPSYIVFVLKIKVTLTFNILFFTTIFIIPILPTVIATIIGSLITAITSRFKRKNLINYIIFILSFIFMYYMTSGISNSNSLDYANFGKNLIDMCNNIYPLTNTYFKIISNNDLISLLIYTLLPILIFIIFTKILTKYYININSKLKTERKNANYKLGKLKESNQLFALYKKEIKRYFGSIMYVTNTIMGSVMLIIMSFGLLIFGVDKIGQIIEIPTLSKIVSSVMPFVISLFVSLSVTTQASISLEGKNLWIIKSIPVKPIDIFKSKIMVNLTVTVIPILISSTIISLVIKPPLNAVIFMYILPILYAVLTSILGLIINLHFPRFDFKNEIYVIKQSIASMISIFVNLILAIIPLAIYFNVKSNMYVQIVSLSVFILIIISYIYIDKLGTKKFNELN